MKLTKSLYSLFKKGAKLGKITLITGLTVSGVVTGKNTVRELHEEATTDNDVVRINGFIPKIVISSVRRFKEMPELVDQLTKFGINYNEKYCRTGDIPKGERRGFDIIKYLHKHNISKNFIVIDDRVEDIKHYVERTNILKNYIL